MCIWDLGDVDVLFTDKTGTLTEGSLRFMRSAGPDGTADDEPLLLGLLCNEAVAESGRAAGGNPLDFALWDSPAAAREHAALARYRRLDMLPFDHERRAVSVLAEDDRGGRMIITKGAPEGLLQRCTAIPGHSRAPAPPARLPRAPPRRPLHRPHPPPARQTRSGQRDRTLPAPASAAGVPDDAPGAPRPASTGPLPLPHETAPAVHSWHEELAPRDPAREPRPAEGQGRT